jgi:hypothetical protein
MTMTTRRSIVLGAALLLAAEVLLLFLLWLTARSHYAECDAALGVKFAFEACGEVQDGNVCLMTPADIKNYSAAVWALKACDEDGE